MKSYFKLRLKELKIYSKIVLWLGKKKSQADSESI
jgi:hypothetical protein